MKVLQRKDQLKSHISELRNRNLSIGLVPTMGALHDGHGSIVERALEENDSVVVSIFVNPTQFDNKEDLKKYPRNLDQDLEFLQKISKEIIVYAPHPEDIYDGNIASEHFEFGGLENEMEGKFRSGHFDGVGTIVKRLLRLVMPDRAYFGEKDYQQLTIIKKLVELSDIPVEIMPHPIYREKDGLAMSSRNGRLNNEMRKIVPFIYKTLQTAKEKFGIESADSVGIWVKEQFQDNKNLKLEYFVIADDKELKPIKEKTNNNVYRAFIAVYADDVRLIDNIALN
ncbi:pantothenate synthetase [Flavobacteriaceae bacterium MAR_2010_188]|nr:pantothenate synthetase [Flavobacteriaceae bacterium MAR_2010_188]